MTLGAFVRQNRPRWQRLEEMLVRIERHGPRGSTRAFLQQLSSLYRATTADLALAQTHYRGTTVLLFLHQLVARAHNQIYRPQRLSFHRTGEFFRHEIPQAIRTHLAAVTWAAIVFFLGTVLGMSAVRFDERAASVVLPTNMLDAIYSHHMWTGGLFSVVPAPVASTLLFTSNITVALLAFAGGLSCGLITFIILFQNGIMLGVAIQLCSIYGLRGPLFEFIASHGWLEISAIIVSGAAGFVLANALLNPGSLSRPDSLSRQGREALRMAVPCVPALVVSGCIEAFISPSSFPLAFKVTLGLVLGALFWTYLFASGKRSKDEPIPLSADIG